MHLSFLSQLFYLSSSSSNLRISSKNKSRDENLKGTEIISQSQNNENSTSNSLNVSIASKVFWLTINVTKNCHSSERIILGYWTTLLKIISSEACAQPVEISFTLILQQYSLSVVSSLPWSIPLLPMLSWFQQCSEDGATRACAPVAQQWAAWPSRASIQQNNMASARCYQQHHENRAIYQNAPCTSHLASCAHWKGLALIFTSKSLSISAQLWPSEQRQAADLQGEDWDSANTMEKMPDAKVTLANEL